MPELVTAGALLVACAWSWWSAGRAGFTVVVDPTPAQLRARTWIWSTVGVACAAVVAWILWPSHDVPPSPGFVVRTGPALSILAMFFLWLALSGALSFSVSSALMGGVIRPREQRGPARRLEHRVTLAAVELAQRRARVAPRVEAWGFLIVGALALLAQLGVGARRVKGTAAGLRVHGFLPSSARQIAWERVESVRIAESSGEHRVVVRWQLADGGSLELDTESLWRLDEETLERLETFHASRGVKVTRER